MPFVQINVIEKVFSTEEKAQLIMEVTEVFGRIKGDEFAAGTWLVVNELGSGNWGEGGSVLLAEDVA